MSNQQKRKDLRQNHKTPTTKEKATQIREYIKQ